MLISSKSRLVAASLLVTGGRALTLRRDGDEPEYHRGELVETFDTGIGHWRPSIYFDYYPYIQAHAVAGWDGTIPSMSGEHIRKFVPFQKREAVEVLNLTTNEWVTGTVTANGTEANTYVVRSLDAGKLVTHRLLMRRTSKPQAGDHVRYFVSEAKTWRDASIDGVIGNITPRYNLTVEGAGGRSFVTPSEVRPFQVFATGDAVRVYDGGKARWLEGGVVSGVNSKDDAYRVYFPGKVFKAVPGALLQRSGRRVDTVFNETVERGARLEFLDESTTWTPCRSVGPGKEPFSYNIELEAPLVGRMEGVSAMLLRRAPSFEAGASAEVIDKSGLWQSVHVAGKGSQPGTYDLQGPMGNVFSDVPAGRVRRYVPPAAGEDMEVREKATGHTTSCTVVGPGEYPHTYRISVPALSKEVITAEDNLRRRSKYMPEQL